MASLSLRHIYKVYDGTTKAVNDFNMEIRDKEFIVFVGPSGCGKSTTLRMIAGLEDISAGELRIDGILVNDVEPGDRNIAMVFQNYALYPHMTVYENMAFALQTARVPKDVIHGKVTEAARILGITEYLERKPKALSGGQRQRVALGRAMVRSPKVFLLDEPLSNLDAKLRAAMRAEITALHQRLGTTFIYVTHDQVEAMTMGTRIVVMRGGFVQQIDTPKNLYNHPANLFVAGFMGTPRMNFWAVTLEKEGEQVLIRTESGGVLTADWETLNRVQARYVDGVHPVVLGVRPDDVVPVEAGTPALPCGGRLSMTVTNVEALGGETLIYGYLGDTPPERGAEEETASREIIVKAPADFTVRRGEALEVSVDLRKLHLFDRDSEARINPPVPAENFCPCELEEEALTLSGQKFPLPPALKDRGTKEGTHTTVNIPSSAVLLGTGVAKATILEVAPADTDACVRTLYRLRVGEQTVFALESASPRFAVGDTVPFDLDFSRITAEDRGIVPLPAENRLDGRFIKEKELDEKGRRVHRFYLEIDDQPVTATEELCEKLFSCKGTAIFRTPLAYLFPAEAVTVSPCPKGVPFSDDRASLTGKVCEILDYGRMVYARIRLGNQSVIAPYNGAVGDTVRLTMDPGRLSVADREADIRMI